MSVLNVSIIFLLLYKYISSDDNMIFSRGLVVDPSSHLKECTDASQCPFSDKHDICEEGYGPDHEQATCINGKCGVIKRCSRYITPSSGIISDLSTTPSTNQCQADAECDYVKLCAEECKDDSGPLCASSKCVHEKCVITNPCSQKSECTDTDVSHCNTPQVCDRCKPGYILPCAEATCEHGQCKVIMRCTIFEKSMITAMATVSSIGTCDRDNQCLHPEICAAKCPNGTTPLCASSKCENRKCIDIEPCSQTICKTKATCPYNKHNCVPCPNDYGPGCEQAACLNGICSTVAPCSKKL
jgi:hypothetical protein